jgi:phage terminase large subunit-like protein
MARERTTLALTYAQRAERYARRILSGRIPACELTRLACQRHLEDLKRAKNRKYPYVFDEEKGNRICRFVERMVHVKGKWAQFDQEHPEAIYIRLEDWQCFLYCVPFGWINRKTGLRRYTEMYVEVPRKNAKSTSGAGIGNYMAFADGEPGAEVYSGATSLDQAMKIFEPAWLMVANNPEFREMLGLELGGTPRNPGNIYQLGTNSKFEPVVGNPGDGSNPHCALIDEFHEHRDPALIETMSTGMGARTQPMLPIFTTAGVNTAGPCFKKHLEAVRVLRGTEQNDRLFVLIFGIDEGDDWKNFDVWIKANPNFNVSVFEDYLRAQLRKALQNPDQQNAIRTKHLNEWLNAGKGWMDMVAWEKCRKPSLQIDDFNGKPCWLAVDLANKIDLASLVALFEHEGGYVLFAWHFLCEATVKLSHNTHYRAWEAAGKLIVTPGARTDFREIEGRIKSLAASHAVQDLSFDPREASYFISSIQEWAGFPCTEITQGPQMMSEPMKEMEALVRDGRFGWDGDPIVHWAMGNVVKKEARTGGPVKYYYPTKEQDHLKIDPVVAAIMALRGAMMGEPVFKSVYETRGLISVG